MISDISKGFKIKEVRRKILFTLLILLVYRIGCFIPVPGIGAEGLLSVDEDNPFLYLQIMSAVSGRRAAIRYAVCNGYRPYINASIIIQLLTVGIPALERLSKQGEEGRKKIATITRYVTVVLAVAQSDQASSSGSLPVSTSRSCSATTLNGWAISHSSSSILRRVPDDVAGRKNYRLRRVQRYLAAYLHGYHLHGG